MTILAQYFKRITEPRASGIGLRIVDLLPALREPNQRWLVLLGPRSVDQREGVTVPDRYSSAEGRKTMDHGLCASDHGALVLVWWTQLQIFLWNWNIASDVNI